MLLNDAHITVDYLHLPDRMSLPLATSPVCMYQQEECIRLERRAVKGNLIRSFRSLSFE